MNKTLRLIAAEMLDIAEEHFSNHSCNDYELPLTPENLEFVREMNRASGYPVEPPRVGNTIYVYDHQLMRHCAKLLKETDDDGGN